MQLLQLPQCDRDTCSRIFQRMYSHKPSLRLAVFGVEDERIVVQQEVAYDEATMEDPELWASVVQHFTANMQQHIGWILTNVRYRTQPGALRSKAVFITWAPDSLQRATAKATIQERMKAVMAGGALAKAMGAADAQVRRRTANCGDDLLLQNLMACVTKGERDAIVPDSGCI